MRRPAWRALAPTVLALTLCVTAQAAGDLSGAWEGNITNERGEHIITTARLVQDGATVTGDLSMYGSAPLPICNGAFDGQILRFEIDRDWQEGQTCSGLPAATTIRFEARLKGPSLSGTADDGKIKGSLFWIQVEEAPAAGPAAEPTAGPAAEPTAEPAAEPTAIVPSHGPSGGGVSPYEITHAFIATVRGEDPAAFAAVWNTRDRRSNSPLLQMIFEKKKTQLRQIADSLETKLASDAFQLQDKGASIEYPCTGRAGAGQPCIFTVVQETDGLWYVEDFD